ncbi:MAG TPA: class I SAM-dependent rRNA methyltransferase [Candidatus Magasanikbacteria bacterium]|nr:class I SAM-dependent rRNA methyltransferase [Candidatus Magasanikbacteria bacterium]
MIKLIINTKRLGPVLARHPWVFSGAIKQIPEGLDCGMPVALVDEQGKFLGQGYFNSYSQIAVRLWSFDEKEEVNQDFFNKRVKNALGLRDKFVLDKNTDSCRLIYGENDFLPGLIVDKYADYLSVQFHNRGIEFWKDQILTALIKTLKPKGVYERSDVKVRGIEGAEKKSGLLFGKVPNKVEIKENGYKFWVDIINGQKTGFFLDQRDKRLALQKYVKNKKVLNCFSYTGGFSVYAAAAGATKTVSVDASVPAIELAKENFKLNKLDFKKAEFIADDVKNYLNGSEIKDENFDVIILDPPAFIKDRHKIQEGLNGYRKINEAAMRLLPPGGILVSASCSAHLNLSDFRRMLANAAGRAGRKLQILETFTHGIDHPEIAAYTEGEYLKVIFALVT